MAMRFGVMFVGALVLLPGLTGWGATDPVGCPETITVNQQLAAPVAGWTPGLDELPHRLAGITFYDGPIADNASLVNDQTTKASGREIATWRFTGMAGRLVWVSCSYAGTAVTLTKSLPAKTSSCAVTFNVRQRVAGLPMIEQVSCK